MTHRCEKEDLLARLSGKVAALERDREADRALNNRRFDELQEQLRRWGVAFTEHFTSLRALFCEKTDKVSADIADLKRLVEGK